MQSPICLEFVPGDFVSRISSLLLFVYRHTIYYYILYTILYFHGTYQIDIRLYRLRNTVSQKLNLTVDKMLNYSMNIQPKI